MRTGVGTTGGSGSARSRRSSSSPARRERSASAVTAPASSTSTSARRAGPSGEQLVDPRLGFGDFSRRRIADLVAELVEVVLQRVAPIPPPDLAPDRGL